MLSCCFLVLKPLAVPLLCSVRVVFRVVYVYRPGLSRALLEEQECACPTLVGPEVSPPLHCFICWLLLASKGLVAEWIYSAAGSGARGPGRFTGGCGGGGRGQMLSEGRVEELGFLRTQFSMPHSI